MYFFSFDSIKRVELLEHNESRNNNLQAFKCFFLLFFLFLFLFALIFTWTFLHLKYQIGLFLNFFYFSALLPILILFQKANSDCVLLRVIGYFQWKRGKLTYTKLEGFFLLYLIYSLSWMFSGFIATPQHRCVFFLFLAFLFGKKQQQDLFFDVA